MQDGKDIKSIKEDEQKNLLDIIPLIPPSTYLTTKDFMSGAN